jgi:hypothetical protein
MHVVVALNACGPRARIPDLAEFHALVCHQFRSVMIHALEVSGFHEICGLRFQASENVLAPIGIVLGIDTPAHIGQKLALIARIRVRYRRSE